jgi:hypothetical protein
VIEPVEEVELWLLTAKQRQSPLVVDLLADLLTDLFQRLSKTPMSSILPEIAHISGSPRA